MKNFSEKHIITIYSVDHNKSRSPHTKVAPTKLADMHGHLNLIKILLGRLQQKGR